MSRRAAWRFVRDESFGRKLGLAPLILPATVPAVRSFARTVAHRRRKGRVPRSDRRFSGSTLSVGQLVDGDGGADLLAAWVAVGLRRRGRKVALACFGPRRSSESVAVVSDGRFVLERVESCGALALHLAAHAPGVPVLAGYDPALVGWRALSAFGADVLVMHDGFRFHGFHRDLDVVCLDGFLGLGNRWTRPRGPLRELVRALGRAHCVGSVDAPLPGPDAAQVERFAPEAHRFEARRSPSSLCALRGGKPESPQSLRGREVGLLAARDDAAPLRRQVESLGAEIVAERLYSDHHRFRPRNLRGLARRSPLWVVPESDATMIQAPWARGTSIRVLRTRIDVVDGSDWLDWIDARLH